MSFPASPVRSVVLSVALTPISAREASSSPQLTPRSKVKAMLATLDGDSEADDRDDFTVKRRRLMPNIQNEMLETKTRSVHEETIEHTSGGETHEEAVVLVPRGRLASRLNGHKQQVDVQPEITNSGSDKENAYARIKKQLMRKHSNVAPTELAKSPVEKLTTPSASQPPRNQPDRADEASLSTSTSSRPRSTTRGLFLTLAPPRNVPEKSLSAAKDDSSDSDLPSNPLKSSRFQELLAKKTAERKALETEEVFKKKKKPAIHFTSDDSVGDETADEDADRKLTQHNRPTRKASKKALEEMNRETQRMSRNMQLAHQAKTKRKISKQSLLDRFQFGAPATVITDNAKPPFSSNAASSAPPSDHEDAAHPGETPATSPLQPNDIESSKPKDSFAANPGLSDALPTLAEIQQDALPDMTDILSQTAPKPDKGKVKTIEGEDSTLPVNEMKPKNYGFKQRSIKIHHPGLSGKTAGNVSGSDSDLEVLPVSSAKRGLIDVFSRMPKTKIQDVRPLQTLRALAHLNSPPESKNRKGIPSVSLSHLQSSLQRKARQQAAAERKAKIEELKARGIIVQSAEEREQEQVEVEDLLEKARRENEEIREKEKRAFKKEKLLNGENGDLNDTSDDDEDYEEGQVPELDIEFSGSEDEGGVVDDEENEEDREEGHSSSDEDDLSLVDDENEGRSSNGLIEAEVSEDVRDEDDIEADTEVETDDEDEEIQVPDKQAPRHRRNRMIIDEDDELDALKDLPELPEIANNAVTPKSPVTKIPSIFQGISNNMPMGMTQAFAATMADTQTQAHEHQDEGQDSVNAFDGPPEPLLPTLHVEDSLLMVEDTQEGTQQADRTLDEETCASHKISLDYSQSLIQYDSMYAQLAASQLSEIPDPTQDAGFVMSSLGPEQRFVSEPPSTVDTIIIPTAASEDAPLLKKRGRLRRRLIEQFSDEGDAEYEPAVQRNEANMEDAFAIMKTARAMAAEKEEFNKKRIEAMEMVENQAQESDDEYAGLGGASDEDSGEEDEDVKAMIDHGEVNVDERKLAALYAKNDMIADDKLTRKLMKDVNDGGLRRKRHAEIDLSDSDDNGEARRRRKQREFAKMRKALLENENVGKLAEDPKRLAFLKSIEDRDDDEDMEIFNRPAEDCFRFQPEESQEESNPQPQETEPAPSKQRQTLQTSTTHITNMRPPANARRTPAPKKPSTLAEIRQSVSFLIEEPGAMLAPLTASSASSDDDENDSDSVQASHTRPQHTHPRRTASNPIIDRLSLKRDQSSPLSAAHNTSQLAFHAPSSVPSSGANPLFRSLLHRASTSNLSSMTDANGISHRHAATERAAGGGEKADFVRRGGGKRSSVNFAVRESQKVAAVKSVERRRRDEREERARVRGAELVSLSRMSTWEG